MSPQTSVKAGSVVKHHYGVVTCQMSGIVLVRSSTTKWRNGTGSKLMSVQVQTWPVKKKRNGAVSWHVKTMRGGVGSLSVNLWSYSWTCNR